MSEWDSLFALGAGGDETCDLPINKRDAFKVSWSTREADYPGRGKDRGSSPLIHPWKEHKKTEETEEKQEIGIESLEDPLNESVPGAN
ncbi:hypothetical protein AVEN_51069-1 [Araneus ventricosus]|uniref:Uncharacterized protein n=1 Tax=Araneus ventricosus TaxID=182803 RepID=A0A4Y2REC6_ARAVE|nr:hypothetical protein AVEN_51069-1 [Araneus ventricosus]